jgi:hypothetical protein
MMFWDMHQDMRASKMLNKKIATAAAAKWI